MSKYFDSLNEFLSSTKKDNIFILADENTLAYCVPLLLKNAELLQGAEIIETESGEHNKNLSLTQNLWEYLTRKKASRNSLWINLGGGVITDLGGFVASTYKRGISFINIPTTLLAQVDASVGDKTGIDFLGYKNQIGVFSQADFTYINPLFLNTLPKRQILSGFAEIIKHALIADKHYWNAIVELDFSSFDMWEKIIRRSVEIKLSIVNADPYEQGLRKVLNFGHTVGHALETWFLNTNTPYLHGEAIAQGIIAEALLSVKNTGLSLEEFELIQAFILSIYGKCRRFDVVEVLEIMQQDKKMKHGKLQFSLLSKIGESTFDCEVPTEDVVESLHYLL
ncbi:MAG TPA: 3-dehydroquinate synthase [Flavobacteriales bacterium]|nr:3-dehydroquinate synthase [Flavobacteriales bacterium]